MKIRTQIAWIILGLALLAACGPSEATVQEVVAERGVEVMPFDLDRSTHVFETTDSGGVQQVLSDDDDAEQIAMIRAHLAEEAARFQEGDFHDPAMIHGDDMAGLHELVSNADKLVIVYSDLPNGGQIDYTSEDTTVISALHAWFDQQVGDHGDHAMAAMPEEESAGSDDGHSMGMGNNSMRVAHHATIPEPYASMTNPISADAASLERGGEIYASSCAVCHGDGGMGDGPAAANLDPAVSPIAHTSQMLGEAYLFWRVSEGGNGDPLSSAMPAWKETLDEQARWDVINYVQALGAGTVEPHSNMGGEMFDPAVEQENRGEMLAEAMALSLITQAESDTFNAVHNALDDLMAETGLRMQGNNMPALLTILIERETVSQADADDFDRVHDILMEAGLMR